MNREIKFRTWDNQNKEFSEWTNRDPFFSTSEGKLFFWERTRKEDGSFGGDIILEDFGDRFVLQQYTGLKDKNGKEIYEGDILKFSNLNYVVMWGNYQWIATCPNYNKYHWPKFEYFSNETRNSDVVGNIFEHPELIK